jgi:hypothetical protein
VDTTLHFNLYVQRPRGHAIYVNLPISDQKFWVDFQAPEFRLSDFTRFCFFEHRYLREFDLQNESIKVFLRHGVRELRDDTPLRTLFRPYTSETLVLLLDVFLETDDPLFVHRLETGVGARRHLCHHECMEPKEPPSAPAPAPVPASETGGEASNNKAHEWYLKLGLVFTFFILPLVSLLVAAYDVTQLLTVILPFACLIISGPLIALSLLGPGASARVAR